MALYRRTLDFSIFFWLVVSVYVKESVNVTDETIWCDTPHTCDKTWCTGPNLSSGNLSNSNIISVVCPPGVYRQRSFSPEQKINAVAIKKTVPDPHTTKVDAFFPPTSFTFVRDAEKEGRQIVSRIKRNPTIAAIRAATPFTTLNEIIVAQQLL